MSQNNILKYHILNDKTVCDEFEVDDYIVENDDSTWINTTYKVDLDKLPEGFDETESDTADALLQYHLRQIPKPEWIV